MKILADQSIDRRCRHSCVSGLNPAFKVSVQQKNQRAMDIDEDESMRWLRGKLLANMSGDILLQLANTSPMPPEIRQQGYREHTTDVSLWSPEAQLSWLAALANGQWEQWVSNDTLRDYYERVLPQVNQQGQQQQDDPGSDMLGMDALYVCPVPSDVRQ